MFVYRFYLCCFALQMIALICSAIVLRSETNKINTSPDHSISNAGGDRSMKRALTTSQVLTFNLTNALILLIMKAIVIVAGILGKISFWKYPNLGGIPIVRSFNSSNPKDHISSQIYDSILSDEDIRWSSAYIWAINKNDFGCLYRLACENPKSAQIYHNSGKIFNRAAKSIFGILRLSYNERYEDILNGLQRALSTKEDCNTQYSCRAPFDHLHFISFLQKFG